MTEYTAEIRNRFWNKVKLPNVIGGSDCCWEWQAYRIASGYGRIYIYRRLFLAHRVAYELCICPIPRGSLVCHSCDNPACVNPAHLWVGTYTDNMLDMYRKERHVRLVGDLNGLRKHPERSAKGLRNGQHTHPERTARGERQGSAKLTESDIRQIRYLRNECGIELKEIAAQFGVTFSNVWHIATRRSWKHVK